MKQNCPKCHASDESIVKSGYFFRKSDSKKIARFRCKICSKHFSTATFSSCYHQNKRRLNPILKNSVCSSMSMRRFAKLYKVSRTTVKRKMDFLAAQAKQNQSRWLENHIKFTNVQLDDLETFEHTKCKPVTVTVFVESGSRKIIDFSVAQIGAKGRLTHIANTKYGKRLNKSRKVRAKLFERVSPFIDKSAVIHSDEHLHYPKLVERYFPGASHKRYRGKKAASTGQGELKKGGYDPLFSVNHTFAMMRYGMSRLVRRTWCTTKCLKALESHIAVYVDFHNQVLTD